jgi:hypothetical protein
MGDTASLQFMITNAMKRTLIDELEFLEEEVEVMVGAHSPPIGHLDHTG